jgi:hypothetical protein
VQLKVKPLAFFGRVSNGNFEVIAELPGLAAQPIVTLHPLANGKIRQARQIRLHHGADLLDKRLCFSIDRAGRALGHQRCRSLGAGGERLPTLVSAPKGAFNLGSAQKAHLAPKRLSHFKGNSTLVNISSNVIYFTVAQVGFPHTAFDFGGAQRQRLSNKAFREAWCLCHPCFTYLGQGRSRLK